MVRVKSQRKRRWGNPSCWQWRHRHSQSLQGGSENEKGSGSAGCGSEHENSLGPFIEIVVGEWDEVGRKRTMMMKRDESEGDQEGNTVEGGRGS